MGYYEELSEGSRFQKVKRDKRGFRITPANDGEECLAAFQDIVKHAIKCSSGEGYVVKPHPSGVQSGRPCDAAILYREKTTPGRSEAIRRLAEIGLKVARK